MSSVEKSFDKVSAYLYELVALLSELQNREALTAAHIKELQDDEKIQEEKYEARTSENNAAIKEAVNILAKWRYEASSAPNPSTPASTPVTAATAQPPQPQRRRFVAVDGFKPKVLGLETTYEDWVDFKKRFLTYVRACYDGVQLEEDGTPSISMDEWTAILLSCVEAGWSKRISFDGYDSIADLLDKFDQEIQLLQPLHLRRIALLKRPVF